MAAKTAAHRKSRSSSPKPEPRTHSGRQRGAGSTGGAARRASTTALARISDVKLPGGILAKRAHVVHARLKRLAAEMTQLMFEFMDHASEAVQKKLYTTLHYQDPDTYFEQAVGFSWRSLRRRLAIHEAVRKLDKDAQGAARQALIELGIHRAAILAPIVGRPGQDWREWAKRAKRLDEDALQREVSQAIGAKPRGRAGHSRDGTEVRETSAKWLDDTLRLTPDDARHEFLQVFEAGRVVLKHPEFLPNIKVLMILVQMAKVELFRDAQQLGWTPTDELPVVADAEASESPRGRQRRHAR